MRSNCKRPIASPSTLDPGSPDTHFTNAVCTPTTAASAFAVHGNNPGTSADTSSTGVDSYDSYDDTTYDDSSYDDTTYDDSAYDTDYSYDAGDGETY